MSPLRRSPQPCAAMSILSTTGRGIFAHGRRSPVPDSLPPDTSDDIRVQVEERIRIEAEALAAREKPADPVITPRLIKQCLQSNELGDGTLYAALHRGQYLYNKNTAQWLAWKGHH